MRKWMKNIMVDVQKLMLSTVINMMYCFFNFVFNSVDKILYTVFKVLLNIACCPTHSAI